jgi:Dyp-type peroxidase family
VSEAGVLAWAGAIAGWLAALTIGTFVVVGARRRRSYDAWRDTMTDLGDGTDAVATAFLVVNLVVGALLGVLAWAVQAAFGAWELTAALVLAATGSALFAVTACEHRCKRPLCKGTAPTWMPKVHLVVAAVVAGAIVVAPFVTWTALDDVGRDTGSFRIASLGLGAAAAVLLGALLVRTRTRNRDPSPASAERARVGLFERLVWTVGYGWVVMLACTLVRPGWPAVLALLSWLVVALRFVLRPDWRDPSPEFDVTDCQPGTVTALHGTKVGVLLVCSVEDASRFGRDLEAALDVGLIAGASGQAAHAVTVAVTARGLAALGVRYRWRAGPVVEDAFGDGMLTRARALGDVGPSGPDRWDDDWRDPDRLHVAFWIQARDADARSALEAMVTCRFRSVREQARVVAAHLGDRRREHFGFVDGVSQPWVEAVPRGDRPRPRGVGKLRSSTPSSEDPTKPHDRWRPIALGEFVLGQVDETGDIFPVPSPPDVFVGGTFLVVRKLRQDVAGFREFAGAGADRGSLATRLVGRTRDGTPLMRPPAADGLHDERADEFTYGRDPEGLLCPLGAHVRRANPRDALGFGTVLTARRRILRRGMPYGPDSDVDGPDDTDRGLLFLAYNVRISEQFEFVQQQWLNDGAPFGLGTSPDPIGGGWDPMSPRGLVVGGRPPYVHAPVQSFVTTAGGEYFLVPSISGLRALADAARSASGPRVVEEPEQVGAARGDAGEPVPLG